MAIRYGIEGPGTEGHKPHLSKPSLVSRGLEDKDDRVAVGMSSYCLPVYWNDRHVTSSGAGHKDGRTGRCNPLTSNFGQKAIQLRPGQRVGRVQQDEPELPGFLPNRSKGVLPADDGPGGESRPAKVLADDLDRCGGRVHEQGGGGPSGQGLDPHRARPGEQVEHPGAFDVRPEARKDRLADTVGDRPGSGRDGSQPDPPGRPGDDPHRIPADRSIMSFCMSDPRTRMTEWTSARTPSRCCGPGHGRR